MRSGSMSEAHVVQGGHGWPGADPNEVRAHAAQWLTGRHRPSVPQSHSGGKGHWAALQRSGCKLWRTTILSYRRAGRSSSSRTRRPNRETAPASVNRAPTMRRRHGMNARGDGAAGRPAALSTGVRRAGSACLQTHKSAAAAGPCGRGRDIDLHISISQVIYTHTQTHRHIHTSICCICR
jgi:hypothetical protein